jgi:hypothetical protein
MSRTDGAAENYLPILVCRAKALAKAGAQIFFQPGEGAGKDGGGGRPVREIGEVMFANGCRQFKIVER